MDNYRCYLMARVQIFKSSRQNSAGEESFTFWVHYPVSTMETQMAAYLMIISLMMMLHSSAKPVLILGFDFWLSRFRTFTCRNWGINNSHTLLEVCPTHIDKVEIKCMGSIGGKIPTEPKLHLFFSSLGHT